MTHSTPAMAPTASAPVPAITPELLTAAQAAELCGIGERTLWRWSRSGLAPRPLSIGHGTRPAVRYARAALLAWIQTGCKPVDGRAGTC